LKEKGSAIRVGPGSSPKRRNRMHTGKIKKIVRERGFGFISDTDGIEVFFHQSGLVSEDFNTLREDQEVEFQVENSAKGPRATDVKTINK
jgi:CspA family cold shock protein